MLRSSESSTEATWIEELICMEITRCPVAGNARYKRLPNIAFDGFPNPTSFRGPDRKCRSGRRGSRLSLQNS